MIEIIRGFRPGLSEQQREIIHATGAKQPISLPAVCGKIKEDVAFDRAAMLDLSSVLTTADFIEALKQFPFGQPPEFVSMRELQLNANEHLHNLGLPVLPVVIRPLHRENRRLGSFVIPKEYYTNAVGVARHAEHDARYGDIIQANADPSLEDEVLYDIWGTVVSRASWSLSPSLVRDVAFHAHDAGMYYFRDELGLPLHHRGSLPLMRIMQTGLVPLGVVEDDVKQQDYFAIGAPPRDIQVVR